VPVSQTRSVSASAHVTGGDPSSQAFSASGFGAFDQTASAFSSNPSQGQLTGTSATIRQQSVIEDTLLLADLNGHMLYTLSVGPTSTQSVFDVTFDLTAPASYFLTNGQESSPWGTHAVTLYDASDLVLASLPSGGYFPPGYPEIAPGVAGVLAPGRYRMKAQFDRDRASDFIGEGRIRAAASLRFTPIPEPGSALLLALGLGALGARRPRTES
jgi:hypothetical protein